jgi:hypothetical protein
MLDRSNSFFALETPKRNRGFNKFSKLDIGMLKGENI